MLVIVTAPAIDLADGAWIGAAEDAAKRADFQTPAGARGQRGGQFAADGAFARERVAEGEQEIEQRLMPGDAHEALEQRGEEKAAHPAVQAIGHARVVHFREGETEPGMGRRVAEAGERGAPEGGDIAILREEDRRLRFGADHAGCGPDIEAFAVGDLIRRAAEQAESARRPAAEVHRSRGMPHAALGEPAERSYAHAQSLSPGKLRPFWRLTTTSRRASRRPGQLIA